MEKSYSELLKDPRWQKKRLKILERDGWRCKLCYSTVKTLNVHHLKYNGKPWEADNDDLITLCKDCHEIVEYWKKESASMTKTLESRHNLMLNILFKELVDNEEFFYIVQNIYHYNQWAKNSIHESYKTDTEEDLI